MGVDEVPKSKPLLYASNGFGILTGLIFTGAGSAKVAGLMDEEISTQMAPFWGLPPLLMKVLLSFEVLGGVCMLGGLAVKSFVKLEESKANLLETLLIMDGLGLTTIFLGALYFHLMTEGNPAPMLPAPIYFALRLAYNQGRPPAEFRMLFFAFAALNLLGLLGAIGYSRWAQ
jgi:hypothetical protein